MEREVNPEAPKKFMPLTPILVKVSCLAFTLGAAALTLFGEKTPPGGNIIWVALLMGVMLYLCVFVMAAVKVKDGEIFVFRTYKWEKLDKSRIVKIYPRRSMVIIVMDEGFNNEYYISPRLSKLMETAEYLNEVAGLKMEIPALYPNIFKK